MSCCTHACLTTAQAPTGHYCVCNAGMRQGANATCVTDAECCSGKCAGGICTCSAAGQGCFYPEDCCVGPSHCVDNGGGRWLCQ